MKRSRIGKKNRTKTILVAALLLLLSGQCPACGKADVSSEASGQAGSEEEAENPFKVKSELSDAEASVNAKRIYRYLADNYGKNIISGQYCDKGIFGHEMAVIWKATGKFPAMVGLDMMDASPSRIAYGTECKTIDQAIEAWENNSLVTICWHWNAPSKYLTGTWYSGFYKEHTNIDLDKIMNGQDPEGYSLLMSDMDAIAKELTRLRDLDIPVLWRPLHEASGGWFWWGNCDAESYIQLYRLMYEKFTKEYSLHNLIWVWNGQSKSWYPGDDVVDLLGDDIYPGKHKYSSQQSKYNNLKNTTDTPMIAAMTENGCLFDPDSAVADGAMWSYFGTWGGEFVTDSDTLNVYSETYTEKEMLEKVYNHERVITRDELPDLKTYGDVEKTENTGNEGTTAE
jgi:mannan endo-1,4-beta-mannosidase